MLPYAPHSARLLCDMHTLDGAPWDACPRSFLKRMIGRASDAGLTCQARSRTSSRWRVATGAVPAHRPEPVLLDHRDGSAGAVMIEMIEALVAQGVFPEQYYPELGPGQQEMPVRYADALRAADNQITVRETGRGVALKHGLIASFAPKPFPDEAGNGSHIHFSLWRDKDGRNHFHDPRGRYGLSDAALWLHRRHARSPPGTRRADRAQRELLPAACSRASGRARTRPGARTIGRPPSACPRSAAASRWSRRISSSSRAIPPTIPIWRSAAFSRPASTASRASSTRASPRSTDPDALSEAERQRRGIRRLPATLGEALDALERDDVLRDALGEVLAREYLLVKRSEVRAFEGKEVAFELAQHFYKY